MIVKDHALHSLRLAPALELDVKAAGDGSITGLASTFGGPPDRQGDVVQRGAFARSLKEHEAEGSMPAMLWAHKMEAPIGHWTEMREDASGLIVSGTINLKTSNGREAFEHIRAGDARGLSIGYVVPEGGRKYQGDGSFLLTEVDLVEVSIVAVAANRAARIAGVKHFGSKAEAVDALREIGLPKAAAVRFAAGGWPALAGDDHHEKAIKLAAAIERATAQLRKAP